NVSDPAAPLSRHEVHVVSQFLPHPTNALDVGLTAELAFGADLACNAGHLFGKRVQLVDHRVDGLLELEDLSADVDGDLLGEVAVRDSGRDLGDVADLAGQVAGHHVDVVGQVFPDAADASDLGLVATGALGADLASDARHLAGERIQLFDHRVDRLGGVEELPLQRPAVDLQRHGLRQIAVGHGADDACNLRVRSGEVFYEVIHRLEGRRPRANRPGGGALELSFLADAPGQAMNLALEALVRFDDSVQRRRHSARGAPWRRGRHARGEVPVLNRL